MSKPNLFIVGAPKSGTTSLYSYLTQHPDIYMSPIFKEPDFFITDYAIGKFTGNLEKYLNLFRGAKNEKYLGEASTRYLYSKKAAYEIYKFNPDARIIALFRNPVEMVPSYHKQLLFNHHEDINELNEALKAEKLRKAGTSIPQYCYFKEGLYYSEIAKYYEQISRYYEVFPQNQIHVILFDDFKEHTEIVFEKLLKFLEVDTSFVPEFTKENVSHTYRSKLIAKLIQVKKPLLLKKIKKIFLSEEFVWSIINKMHKINTVPKKINTEIEQQSIKSLVDYYKDDVLKLGELLQKDLYTSWIKKYEGSKI